MLFSAERSFGGCFLSIVSAESYFAERFSRILFQTEASACLAAKNSRTEDLISSVDVIFRARCLNSVEFFSPFR